MNTVTTHPPKEPTMEVFWTGTKKIRKEGVAVPSRIAVLLSQYSACQGWPYRFQTRDVLDLHENAVLPGGVQTDKRCLHFSLPAVLDWICDSSAFEGAIKKLDEIAALRTSEEQARKIAEEFQRDILAEQQRLYRDNVRKEAESLCMGLTHGLQFESDLQQAVAEVIRKHYAQIPSVIAKLLVDEVDTKLGLGNAALKYGHRFTAGILDGLTESWLKRILSRDRSSTDHEAVNKALKWVGSTKEGRSSVYVVKPTGTRAVKIGIAECLESRICGIQTGCPFPVKCLLAFPGGRKAEEALHNAFVSTRLSGEWFVLDSTMKEFIVQGRNKLHKLLALTESERYGKKVSRHLALIHKHAAEDRLSMLYGLSGSEAERMAGRINAIIDDPESMPDNATESVA